MNSRQKKELIGVKRGTTQAEKEQSEKEGITIRNLQASSNRTSKYIKQKVAITGKMNKSTIRVGDFNWSHSEMERSKISTCVENFKSTVAKWTLYVYVYMWIYEICTYKHMCVFL